MIFICLDGEAPPEDLVEKARQVTLQLDLAGTEEERNRIIDANPHVWGSFKDWLLSLSHGKCWFSEAKDVYSHPDVDHCRPKKRARHRDGTEREGYS